MLAHFLVSVVVIWSTFLFYVRAVFFLSLWLCSTVWSQVMWYLQLLSWDCFVNCFIIWSLLFFPNVLACFFLLRQTPAWGGKGLFIWLTVHWGKSCIKRSQGRNLGGGTEADHRGILLAGLLFTRGSNASILNSFKIVHITHFQCSPCYQRSL